MKIMGILNVTPDSFSDGGKYFSPGAAIERALELERQGADILDIGAQSTRPGCEMISPEEELRRLRPVLEGLRGKLGIPVSVDTFYPEVAEEALSLGVGMINDVSGIVNEEMAGVVRAYGASWVLMHNQGGADSEGQYGDVVRDVRAALEKMAERAMALGIIKERICLDPGIGFGKSREDNLRLLASLARVKAPGFPLLVGVSRKRVTGGSEAGTLAAQVIAQMGGADILRTHDVARARQASSVAAQISRAISCDFVLTNDVNPCKIERPRMERIGITGLELYARHGVNPEERLHGQVFLLDLLLEADLAKACRSDNIEDTVNYAQVMKLAARVFAQPCSLIECAAELTAQAVLEGFPAVEAVTVRVHKPDAPVKLPFEDISIEVCRRREKKTL